MALASGALIVKFPGGASVLATVLFGGLGLAILVRGLIRWPDDPQAPARILRWTMAAFASRLVFGLVVSASGQLRQYLGPDANYYHATSAALAHHWLQAYPAPPLPSGKEGFIYLLAALYWLLGTHFAAGVALNAALGAALVPLLSDTTHRVFGREAARYAAPLVVMVPGLLIWTSQLLREACVLLLIALALNAATRAARRPSMGCIVCLAVSLTLLFTVRGSIALEVAGAILVGLILGGRRVVTAVGSGVLALGIVAAVIVTVGLGYSGYRAAVNTDLVAANAARRGLAVTANSGFGANVDISTPGRAVSYLPVGLVIFAVGPFPWQLHGLGELGALPQDIVWWCLLPSLWRGVKAGRRKAGQGIFVLALPPMATSAVLALAIGNFGALERERTQVIVMVLPFIAAGLAERATRRGKQTAEGTTGRPKQKAVAVAARTF
jgi:hypothetical protein